MLEGSVRGKAEITPGQASCKYVIWHLEKLREFALLDSTTLIFINRIEGLHRGACDTAHDGDPSRVDERLVFHEDVENARPEARAVDEFELLVGVLKAHDLLQA